MAKKKKKATRKTATKKKATRKKATRKKAATKRKVTRKKAATKKKATRKKATRKKAATKKKATRKTATKKKATKKKATRKAAPKKKKAKKKTKRKPNAAFMRPLNPSASLSSVVGSKPIPRTQVVKKLWAYIRKHNLQDSKNRRMINADARLKPIFGGKRQVSMFEMTKYVSKHLK